jgi:hypothetical protein
VAQFANEERVAGCALVDRLDYGGRRDQPGCGREHLAGVLHVEPGELEHLRTLRDLGENSRGLALQFVWPVGPDDQHLVGQEAQQLQRREVCPVQIVQYHDQRLLACRDRQQRGHRLIEGEPGARPGELQQLLRR